MPPRITPLQAVIARRIRYGVPVSVADYMRECLTHPQYGFYSRTSNLKAHFLTSPDVGQVFGELVGAWASAFAPRRLVELGAGSGNLLKHACRALPSNNNIERLDILENSGALRKVQETNLNGTGIKDGNIHWHDTISSVLDSKTDGGNGPAVVIAHEFFDALPVHLFRAQGDGQWREVLIDVDSSVQNSESNALHFSLAKGPTLASVTASKLLASWNYPGDNDSIAEVSFDALGITEKVAKHVSHHGGAALFVDYCVNTDDGANSDTLRAYHRHEQVDILKNPGECDITYDVNFAHMRHVIDNLGLKNIRIHGPVSQRLFLLRLGVAHRFRKLAVSIIENNDGNVSEEEIDRRLEALQANYHRLVDSDMMGEKFGVFAITRNDAEVPEGFR